MNPLAEDLAAEGHEVVRLGGAGHVVVRSRVDLDGHWPADGPRDGQNHDCAAHCSPPRVARRQVVVHRPEALRSETPRVFERGRAPTAARP
jgi:hypothetical protein